MDGISPGFGFGALAALCVGALVARLFLLGPSEGFAIGGADWLAVSGVVGFGLTALLVSDHDPANVVIFLSALGLLFGLGAFLVYGSGF